CHLQRSVGTRQSTAAPRGIAATRSEGYQRHIITHMTACISQRRIIVDTASADIHFHKARLMLELAQETDSTSLGNGSVQAGSHLKDMLTVK
ncbi:MAG: hypothetical protein ACREBR_02560, partial [bacterium]